MDISEFKRKHNSRPFQRHPWEIARGKFITGLVTRAKKPPVGHIADIGCGDGYIINLLAEKKMAGLYTAFDHAFDQDTLALIRKSGREDIRYFREMEDPVVSQLPKPDIILLLDVLEHTPYEGGLFTAIKTAFRTDPDTQWIITVPAFQAVFSHHDSQLGHYRRYNLRQLGDVCKKNNFLIDKKGYFFLSLLMVRILQMAKKRKAGSREDPTIQNWNRSRFLTRLLTGILRADYKIGRIISNIGVNIPGLSCYCICHQSQ